MKTIIKQFRTSSSYLITLFSHKLNSCASFNTRDQVPHPFKATVYKVFRYKGRNNEVVPTTPWNRMRIAGTASFPLKLV
jgi:hypothetical protein